VLVKVSIPYRMVIVLHLVILYFFFHCGIANLVPNAYALWFVFVSCEIWFVISSLFDQFQSAFCWSRNMYWQTCI